MRIDDRNVDAHHYLANTLRDQAAQPVGSAGWSKLEVAAAKPRRRRRTISYLEESVSEYQVALRLEPDSVEILDGLGQTLLLADRIDDARDALLDALACLGPGLDTQVNLNKKPTSVQEYDTPQFHSEGKSSISSLASSDESQPVHLKVPFVPDDEKVTTSAAVLTHLAAVFTDRGEPNKAVDALRTALRLQPQLGAAYYEMGRAMHKRQKFKKAVTAHRTAVEITPSHSDAYVGLGCALLEEGYYEDGAVALRAAVELGGASRAKRNHGAWNDIRGAAVKSAENP